MIESQTKNIRGIIMGFGNMGQTHLDRYKILNVGVVAVIETDDDKMRLAQSAGFNIFTSLRDIPEAPSYDFIDICTPTYLHFQHIQEAMKHRKPIFVEKPLVRTLDEARKLRSLDQDYPYSIFVGEVEQFNPLLSGFFDYQGRPKRINISREVNLEFFLKGTKPWFLDTNLSGGIVLDLMIHDINLLVAKYGVPKVGNVESSRKKYDCVDKVTAELHFEGFDVTVHSDWTAQREDSPISTSIKIDDANGQAISVYCDNYVIKSRVEELDAFAIELEAFLKTIRTGQTPYSLSTYLAGVEIALQITSKLK